MTRKTTLRTLLGALVVAGLSAGLSACDDSTSSSAPKDITTADQKASFRSACTSKGGTIHETSCKGTSTCAGLYLNGETGKTETTSCKGTNSCAGLQCLDSTQAKQDTAAMKTAARLAVKAAKTDTSFKAACKAAGSMAREESTCTGHNSCAGIRFLTATSKTEESSCSGKGSCQGLSCPL